MGNQKQHGLHVKNTEEEEQDFMCVCVWQTNHVSSYNFLYILKILQQQHGRGEKSAVG